MKYRNIWLRKYSTLTFLGLSLLGLAVPLSAQAGGVHVSVGFEFPLPVAVIPAPVVVAPAPVIVHRPPVIIEQHAPVFVQPAPVVLQQQPVVIEDRRVVYRDHLPPGLAKTFHGYKRVHWKHHHHHDD